MSTFTATKQLEQVARGADVGTWDTPTNSNWGIVDAALAQITSISLNNTPVILNAAQFQCAQIALNSTLTGNVSITFPTSFTGPYIVQNNCTGSSAFVITLQTTAAGGQIVGCPFGELFDVFNDGTSIKFRNLGRIGVYEDWMCSSLPAWVSACSVPPYLNCLGGSFSSAIYPTLATLLGGTTLPDSRSKPRITLAQGSTVLSSANSGITLNTLGATGGLESATLAVTNLPNTNFPVTDPGHTHSVPSGGGSFGVTLGGGGNAAAAGSGQTTGLSVTNISVNSGGSNTPFSVVQPSYVGGITVVRAG